MSGVHSQLPVILMNYHSVANLSDMEAYISRIGGVSRALGQQLDWARDNAERGVRPPRYAYEFVMEASSGLISGQPFDDNEQDSALWNDAQTKIGALVEAGEIDEAAAEGLRVRARDGGPAFFSLPGAAPAGCAGAGSSPPGT